MTSTTSAQGAADALRAFAVIAFVPPDGAGSLFAQPPGVFGGGHVAGPPEGGVVVGSQLVDAHDKVDLLMAEDGGGHPVARAVDVDELASLRHAVDRGDIHIRRHSLSAGVLRRLRTPVPEHPVVSGQLFVKAHLLRRDGAADAHRYAVNGAIQIVRGLLRRGKRTDAEPLGFQIFFDRCKIRHGNCLLIIPSDTRRSPRPARRGRHRRSKTPPGPPHGRSP